MKKIFGIFLVFVMVFSGIVSGYAADQSSEKETYVKDMLSAAKTIFEAAPRQEGTKVTGLAGDGKTIYTTYPTIKKDVRDKLISKRLEEIKAILQKYELEVLKEGFAEFKKYIKDSARFIWLPKYGKPQYVELDIYLDSIESVFSGAEYSVEDKKLKEEENKKNQAYQKTWIPGMPSAEAHEKVEEAIRLNYVPQKLQSEYQKPITREEFAELFVTAIFEAVNRRNEGVKQSIKDQWEFSSLTVDNFLSKVSSTEKFTDTNNKYVAVANVLGIVNSASAHKYNPTGSINKEQMAEMIANYVQTRTYSYEEQDFNQISDLSTASNKDAIKRVFLSGIMNAKKNPVIKDGKLAEKGLFDNKAVITREEAILIIMNLHNSTSTILSNLLLRGYVDIDMDELMSGFDIDGDTVKMRKSGYDSKPYAIEKYMFLFSGGNENDDLTGIKNTSNILKYSSEKFDSIFLGLHGTEDMLETSETDKVLSGKNTVYDYKIFKVEHNKNGYLVTITRSNKYKYFCGFNQFIDNNKLIEISLIKKDSPIKENTVKTVNSSLKSEKLRNMEKNTYVSYDSVFPQQWYFKDKSGNYYNVQSKKIGDQVGYAIELDKEVYLNGKQIKSYSIGGETAFMLDELKDFGYSYKLVPNKGEIELHIPNGESIKKYSETASKKIKCIEGNSIYTLIGDNYRLIVKDEKNNEIGELKCYKAKTGERFIFIDDLWMTNVYFYGDKYGSKVNTQYYLNGSINQSLYHNRENDLAAVERVNDKFIKINLLSRSESYKYYHREGSQQYLANAFPELGKIVFSKPNYEAWLTAKDIINKIITGGMTDSEKVAAIQEYMHGYGYYVPGGLYLNKAGSNYHDAYQALVGRISNYTGWFYAYRMLLVQAGLETFPGNENDPGNREFVGSNGYQNGLVAVKVDGKWEFINFLPQEYEY